MIGSTVLSFPSLSFFGFLNLDRDGLFSILFLPLPLLLLSSPEPDALSRCLSFFGDLSRLVLVTFSSVEDEEPILLVEPKEVLRFIFDLLKID